MKTECNDLDEKATVRNFISWSFFFFFFFEVESYLYHTLMTSFVCMRTKGIEYYCKYVLI